MKTFWFVSLTSLAIGVLALLPGAGLTVAAATAVALILAGRFASRRASHTPQRPVATRRARKRVILISSVLVAVGLVVSQLSVGAAVARADEQGTVVRVVDGDTVDVQVDGAVKRVRLLNVDTPETVDPESSVECLGQEASEYTSSTLPVTTPVTLKFDGEQIDGYGRTLAALWIDGSVNVSELIAAQGLGSPVDYGHEKFLGPVLTASKKAENEAAGIFDPDMDCTAAGMTTALSDRATVALVRSKTSAPMSVLERSARRASRFLALVDHENPARSSIWRLYDAAYRTSVLQEVDSLARRASSIAQAPSERRAAIAAAKAAADHKRAVQVAKERARAKAARVAAERARQDAASERRSEDLSGYTGCRRYAPGGKTWVPIPC